MSARRYDYRPAPTGTKRLDVPHGIVWVDADSLVRPEGKVTFVLEPGGRVRAFARLGEIKLSPEEADRVRYNFGLYR